MTNSAPLDGGDSAQVTALACTNGGNCDLVGNGSTPESNSVDFAEREISGTWKPVQDESTAGELDALSCSSAGNCGAVGNNNSSLLFETAGTWNAVTPASDEATTASTALISCPTRNWCAITAADSNGDFAIVGGSPS